MPCATSVSSGPASTRLHSRCAHGRPHSSPGVLGNAHCLHAALQAAEEKKEPLPMLNLPYCHADPFPEEPTGIEGTDTSDLDRVELSKFLNCAMRALPPQCREALCAA